MPPSLSSLLTKYGSDKNTDHSYGCFYDELAEFLQRSGKPLCIMELGVQRGGSIRAFMEYFGDQAVIHGVDLNVDSIRTLSPRIKAYVADQSNRNSLQSLVSQLQSTSTSFDLIIDDGSHAIADQLLTVETLWNVLAPGGFYVVEDLQHPENAKLIAHYPGYRLVDFRELTHRSDDMLIVLRKPNPSR